MEGTEAPEETPPGEDRRGLRGKARLLRPATALLVLVSGATTFRLTRGSAREAWSAVPAPVPAEARAAAAAQHQRLANRVLDRPSQIGATGTVALAPHIVHPVVLAARRGHGTSLDVA